MLKATDTEELEKFYEYIFVHMKNFFDTPGVPAEPISRL